MSLARGKGRNSMLRKILDAVIIDVECPLCYGHWLEDLQTQGEAA